MAPAALSTLAEFVFFSAVLLLVFSWQNTGGLLVQWLIDHVPHWSVPTGFFGRIHVFGWLLDALEWLNNYTASLYAFYLEQAQASWNEWVHQAASFVTAVTESLDLYADETGRALHWLRRHVVPTVVATAVLPVAIARRHGDALAFDGIDRLRRDAAIAEARIGAIHVPTGQIRELEREAGRLRARLRQVAASLTPASIIALVGATVFSSFGLSWLRCSGVRKMGRRLCGLGGWLEELLAVSLDALVVTDLCQVATLMGKGARLAAPALDELASMTGALIRCQGATRPAALPVTWQEPPPVVASLTL